ncbi:YcnI family protein [Streptomyces sp. NPDC014733]|uniref:YcnI family copper-binding membrane protein n=1 Tax=Streptomyces sp. NPDC014733 TaxID=3364885 RepID=UPI00370209F2
MTPGTTTPDTTPDAPHRGRRIARRLPVIGGVAAAGVLVLAGPAFAHVSVVPGTAEQGSYATVNIKVPNERDHASTVKVEVNLPTDHPLASVMPQPVPGWKVEVTEAKLDKPLETHGEKIDKAPSKITWTADGKGIAPGQFQQFPLSVGQLPDHADQIVFKALQTYDNKEVVRWIEPAKKGAPEPENPAPVLALTPPAGGADGAGDAKPAATTTAAADASGSDSTARVLGVVGIVVGIIGVGFGVFAGRRRTA